MKNILLITEPSTHPEFDTTNELYNRLAASPEFNAFHLPSGSVSADPKVKVVPLDKALDYQEFLSLNNMPAVEMSLPNIDLVFDRTDKPRPSGFLEALMEWESITNFVNSPKGLKQVAPHSFFVSVAKDLLGNSLYITELDEFLGYSEVESHFVAKAENSYGGKGVYQVKVAKGFLVVSSLKKGDQKFNDVQAAYDWITDSHEGGFLLRPYLKNVSEGDKRVLVVDGQVYGGYVRKNESGSWIQNITSGAKAFETEISEYEKAVIEQTCGAYHSLGLRTLGYDFLQDDTGQWQLSEINAGNIGGYGRLEQISGMQIYDRLLGDLCRN